MLRRILLLALACLLSVGCKKTGPPPVTKSPTAESKTDVAQKPASKKKRPAPVKRTSMEGNWVVQSMRADLPLPPAEEMKWQTMGLLKIAKKAEGEDQKGGKFNVTVVQSAERSGPIEVLGYNLRPTDAIVILGVRRTQQIFRFQAVLQGTVAKGSMLDGRGRFCLPARFIATDGETLEGFNRSEASPHHEEFAALSKLRPPPPNTRKGKPAVPLEKLNKFLVALRKFVADHPDDPLAFSAQSEIVSRLFLRPKSEVSDAELEKELDRYIKILEPWQPRIQQFYRQYYAAHLTGSGRDRRIIVKLMKDAEAATKLPVMQGTSDVTYRNLRETAEIEIAAANLEAGKDRDASIKALKKFLMKRKFHPLIYYAFAVDAEKQGDVDTAIAQYAAIVAIPQMETQLSIMRKTADTKLPPMRKKLEELWTKKHSDTKTLEQYLDQIYSTKIAKLVTKKAKPQPSGQHARAVLCELFTNGSVFDPEELGSTLQFDSAPLEMALSAIEQTYAATDVIALRYHMKHPLINSKSLDPLMCEDAEPRAFECKVGRPPALFVNGLPSRAAAGTVAATAPNYTTLHSEIDRELKAETSPPTIQLKVTHQGDEIGIDATALQLPKSDEDLRLLLVLAEKRIDFISRNQVRYHEMVVRHIPGGADGVKPDKGKIHASQKISVSKLRRKMLEYLHSLEERQTDGIKFPSKPLALVDLHVVAFVYDNRTMKVLQAVSTPVDGPAPQRPQPEPAKNKKPIVAPRPKSAG